RIRRTRGYELKPNNPFPLALIRFRLAAMVWCNHCAKKVDGFRPEGGALACNKCGRILENFNFSDEVTFIKNAAGQSQASGNIVRSVQSGITSCRARRSRIAKDELMNLRDALQIGEDRDDVVNMASRLFDMAADQNFTKGRRSELVLSSCLYLACRKKELAVLLIDFSSYLRVCVYELGSVYLQLCELFYMVDNPNLEDLEELVDPSIFIDRFTKSLLKGAHAYATTKKVVETTKNIIASMKRDWMQTGRKPSGICGAAIYIAALSHGVMCSTTDIAHIVHMCGATITKRLNEFANTGAATLTVEELDKSEESILLEKPFTPRPNSDKEVVNCKHKDSKSFGYGLCRDCHEKFMKVSGGVVGGSDPPAFQRAEKERMEKASREENEGGIEKSVRGETYWNAEDSDESDNLSDLDGDPVVDGCFLDEDEKRAVKKSWEFLNADWLKEQAAKEAALKTASDAFNASNANCPEYARNLVEASKAYVSKSRKEKRQKREEEAKNAPPASTALEACTRVLESKKLSKYFNPDRLKELFNPDRLKERFDTSSGEKSPKKSRTETVIENKKEVEIEEEEEEDGYDFGLQTPQGVPLVAVEDPHPHLASRPGSGRPTYSQGNNPKNTPLPPEEKPEVVPIIQRNLRPRKPAAIVVEDVTSSEHNKPEVPHQSGSSPDKDLKLWLSEQLQNMARGNYERLETMERNICFHLGVSPPNVHNTRKRKADDDSPKTGGIQAQWPPCKSRRTNSTFTKPTTKIHSYPQRSADRLQENIGLTPPYFNKESRDDNDCAHDRTPPFDEHVNYQEPRTPYAVPDEANAENPITTITIYNPLIFVRPQSYVSPTKSVIDELPCISYLTPTKRFGDEIPVTVTWEETNPHAYTSGKIAPATDVETLSRDVSATKTQSAAVTEGASRDSVAVGNERSPVEEDENYESCQENISIDTLLQEKHHLAVETLPGPDTDEDDNSVESGGKRVRKKSQKIRGVYTPDARLKGLFMSEKKTECMPLPKTSRAIFKKFSDILSENLVQQFEIKTSHIVTNSFFLDIATPGKWTSDECTKSVKECAFTHGIGLKESITTRGVVIVRLEPLSLWRCIVMVMGKKR
ncbi:unnamed protein product, partial [Brassica napus]